MFAEKKRPKLEETQSSEMELEMVSTGLYKFKCKVCAIYCDTLLQLNKHKESAKHIKKSEEQPNTSHFVPFSEYIKSRYTCKICQVKCDTKGQLEIHYNGQPHLKKLRVHESKSHKVLSTDVVDLLTPTRTVNSVVCQICNQSMDTDIQYNLHCQGSKHQRKLKNLNISDETVTTETTSIGIGDLIYCDICQITIDSNNMDSHYKGKIHKEKQLKMTQLTDVSERYPKKTNLTETSLILSDLKLKPRKYQTEIYEKSLNKDCVIFLPTGTGKTFVACMLILRMLEENPHHRVAFIVDKVLLVIQQHDFLKDQYENVSMKRFDQDGSVSNRKLRLVGLANSYANTEYDNSVGDHDIVVATAELFRGLLSDKKLLWSDFCLVVLDEAHHCVKDHPYNKLLREYQLYPESVLLNKFNAIKQLQDGIPKVNVTKLADWKRRRCKIIGLTASPAGELDKENTYLLLVELLESLGGVDVVNVTENITELETFTSTSKIETRLVDYNNYEFDLREIVKSTFFDMLKTFELSINDNNEVTIAQDCQYLSIKDVSNFKMQMQNCLPLAGESDKTAIKHLLVILDIINAVDTFGFEVAWRRLKSLVDNPKDKDWLNSNTSQFLQQIETLLGHSTEKESSLVQAILEEAKGVCNDSRTVLVLVKERETARQLESVLKKTVGDQKLILLVGHGSTSRNGNRNSTGMSVVKQKKALNLINGRDNQIIVATSVADEGIDLPECDLVVLINPPSSVQALVQVRGRARKKSSRLMLICREQGSIDELKQLQIKETNIIAAVNRILNRD